MTTYQLLKTVLNDLRNHGGNTFLKQILLLVFNMSFRLVLNYRFGFFLAERRNFIVNIFILTLKKSQIRNLNCDISYHAKIGQRIKFPHPLSIVIGDNAIVGDDVMIWQEVTLGSDGRNNNIKKYPIIENKVKLYSGCKVIGGIIIGESAIVAANSVVLTDVKPHQTVAGVPAKNI